MQYTHKRWVHTHLRRKYGTVILLYWIRAGSGFRSSLIQSRGFKDSLTSTPTHTDTHAAPRDHHWRRRSVTATAERRPVHIPCAQGDENVNDRMSSAYACAWREICSYIHECNVHDHYEPPRGVSLLPNSPVVCLRSNPQPAFWHNTFVSPQYPNSIDMSTLSGCRFVRYNRSYLG